MIAVITSTPQHHFPPLFSFSHCLTFSLSVIARLDRAIHHFMSCFSDTPVKPEYDREKKVPEHDRTKKAIIAEKSRSMR